MGELGSGEPCVEENIAGKSGRSNGSVRTSEPSLVRIEAGRGERRRDRDRDRERDREREAIVCPE